MSVISTVNTNTLHITSRAYCGANFPFFDDFPMLCEFFLGTQVSPVSALVSDGFTRSAEVGINSVKINTEQY